MTVHQKEIQDAAIKVSGLRSFRFRLLKMRVVSCGAACDKTRHWWRKQQGPHTLRPISMVQHIKFSFTDKRHSALLLVTLVLQQVVSEWEMASLRLNHHSTYLLSKPFFSSSKHEILNAVKDTTYHKIHTEALAVTSRKIDTAEFFDCFFSCFTSRKCKFSQHILVPMLTDSLFSISNGNWKENPFTRGVKIPTVQ